MIFIPTPTIPSIKFLIRHWLQTHKCFQKLRNITSKTIPHFIKRTRAAALKKLFSKFEYKKVQFRRLRQMQLKMYLLSAINICKTSHLTVSMGDERWGKICFGIFCFHKYIINAGRRMQFCKADKFNNSGN